MRTYFTLEKSIENISQYDGSIYKSYVTSFFSYSKSHHTINDFYDEEGNVYIPEVYSFCEKKIDPDTNEIMVRADVEFEDGLNMDFLLHKPLHFKNPEWFHDLTNEKINKIECSFSDWDISVLLDERTRENRTINISIYDSGRIQIEDSLISTYQIDKTYISQFFEAMKQNLGSETTYDPRYVGGWSKSFVLYCESGNILTYHGDYCMDDEKNTTTKIVEELLKKCQITI